MLAGCTVAFIATRIAQLRMARTSK